MGLDLKYIPGVTRWDPIRRIYVIDLAQHEMRKPKPVNVVDLSWWRMRRRRRQ